MNDAADHAPTDHARRAAYVAAAIAVAAIAVRVVGLGRESLWLDEGFTWRLSHLSPSGIFAASRADVHPPLFALLVRLVVWLWGDSENALRSVSVIASCASVWLAGRLARRAFGRTAAFGAAALIALSAFQVHYAQEARAYALLGFLALASCEALLATLESGGMLPAAAWVAATTALLYTHAHAVFVVLAQALVVGWTLRTPEGRRAARPLLWPAVIVALAFAPWAGTFAGQAGRVSAGFWIGRPVPFDLARTLYEFAGSLPLVGMLGALVTLGLLRPAHPVVSPRAPARALIVALALVPLLAPFAASLLGPPIYVTRAAIPASFGLAVLAAAGWAALRPRVRPAAAICVVLACVPPLVDVHVRTYKEPWRDAVEWLDGQTKSGDLVLVTAPWYRDGVFAYYHVPTGLEVLGVPGHGGPMTAADIEALRGPLASHPRVWLVRARADDPDGLLPAALANGRDLVARREWLVTPAGLTRSREVRAFDLFCYAARAVSAPDTTSRASAPSR